MVSNKQSTNSTGSFLLTMMSDGPITRTACVLRVDGPPPILLLVRTKLIDYVASTLHAV